ncbi:hypothetical protein BJ912DRAFT_1049429 [Pholiota molesta]|nr:hypothetical protein BJ912DRAFT_1049429 [Pholiota molesta]
MIWGRVGRWVWVLRLALLLLFVEPVGPPRPAAIVARPPAARANAATDPDVVVQPALAGVRDTLPTSGGRTASGAYMPQRGGIWGGGALGARRAERSGVADAEAVRFDGVVRMGGVVWTGIWRVDDGGGGMGDGDGMSWEEWNAYRMHEKSRSWRRERFGTRLRLGFVWLETGTATWACYGGKISSTGYIV